MDREDEKLIVENSFEQFQDLYRPIMKNNFNDCFEIDENGIFRID